MPGYTWDCFLKYTNCRLDTIQAVDILMFIELARIRQCSNSYSVANNKYLPNYNPENPSSYIFYLDVNNLYGWAMREVFPCSNFRFEENVESFETMLIPDDAPKECILEVDLDYPDTQSLIFVPNTKFHPDQNCRN